MIADIASNVATGTELRNIAELEWTDSRGPHNEEDPTDIEVTTLADLVLEKIAIDEEGEETGNAVAGTESTYRITASNNEPSDVIASVVVEDTLPAGISFIGLTGGSSSNWSAEPEEIDPETGTQQVVFTLLPAGEAGLANGVTAPVIEFDVRVDSAVEEGETLVNTATVSSGTPESDESNNTDTAPLEVNREVDVAIVKSHDADAVRIGDPLPFSLDVTNNGPSEATGITVTDDVPAGLDVLTAVGDLGEGWTIRWSNSWSRRPRSATSRSVRQVPSRSVL